MTRRAAARQSDIARALKAAESVGVRVTVEITRDGVIRLVPAEQSPLTHPAPLPSPEPDKAPGEDEWDAATIGARS